jgi:hypothetical protein
MEGDKKTLNRSKLSRQLGQERPAWRSISFIYVLLAALILGYFYLITSQSKQLHFSKSPLEVNKVLADSLPAAKPLELKREHLVSQDCSLDKSCAHFNSCQQAKHYMQACPNARLDDDGDGTPCEHRLCIEHIKW